VTTDPLRFAEACGAWAPLDLRIQLENGNLLAEGTLDAPNAIVGSTLDCDVTLTAPEVSPRHAILQMIGGRVVAADLGSAMGLFGPNGRVSYTWVDEESPVGIGPFYLSLCGSPGDSAVVPGNPLIPDPVALAALPKVDVQFLKGKAGRAEWTVSRIMTFVGRDKACKLGLTAEDVADFHCYLLLTPRGLWVVDLLTPGGIKVNGEPVRFCLVNEQDVVEVGRFRLGFAYPNGLPEQPETVIPLIADSLPVMTPPRPRGMVVTLPGPTVIRPPDTNPAVSEQD